MAVSDAVAEHVASAVCDGVAGTDGVCVTAAVKVDGLVPESVTVRVRCGVGDVVVLVVRVRVEDTVTETVKVAVEVADEVAVEDLVEDTVADHVTCAVDVAVCHAVAVGVNDDVTVKVLDIVAVRVGVKDEVVLRVHVCMGDIVADLVVVVVSDACAFSAAVEGGNDSRADKMHIETTCIAIARRDLVSLHKVRGVYSIRYQALPLGPADEELQEMSPSMSHGIPEDTHKAVRPAENVVVKAVAW